MRGQPPKDTPALQRPRWTVGSSGPRALQDPCVASASPPSSICCAVFLFIGRRRHRRALQRPRPSHDVHLRMRPGPARMQPRRLPVLRQNAQPAAWPRIDKGDNDDLILQGFVQEYGPTVIAAPTATGFNRMAWIMPFVVVGAWASPSPSTSCARGRIAPRPRWPMASSSAHGHEARRIRERGPQGDRTMRFRLRTEHQPGTRRNSAP